MKKAVSILLAVLLIALCGCGANNETGDTSDVTSVYVSPATDFEYAENEDGITVTKYIGESTEVAIPETIDGKPVTEIGKNFAMLKPIISVRMPDTVHSIGDLAFDQCWVLESVQLSAGLLTIEDRAFRGCACLKSIELPEGLTTIGPDAFSGCTALKEISIPKTVVTIDTEAFYLCVPERITFAEGSRLETIGYCAFGGAKITELTLPSSVRRLESSAFSGCGLLTKVTLNDGLQRIGSNAFNYTGLRELVIPASVTDLEYLSFYNGTFETNSFEALYFEGDLPEDFFERAVILEDVSGVTIYLHEGARGFEIEGAERFTIETW